MTTKKPLKEAVQVHQQQVEQLYTETTAQVQDILSDTQEKIEAEAKELNQTIQTQLVQIKSDIVKRLEVIKSQFNHSQGDLLELVTVLKNELVNLSDDLGKIGKEVKKDINQVTLKHKDTLTDVLKRSKEHALEAWSKARESI
ncbi:hypothetical protein [Acinetobacter baylyi]|uniref:hypothetical protein n=1 Tax=Acinetobacter baylyi TaxID=202950 RepID=UPI0031D207CF